MWLQLVSKLVVGCNAFQSIFICFVWTYVKLSVLQIIAKDCRILENTGITETFFLVLNTFVTIKKLPSFTREFCYRVWLLDSWWKKSFPEEVETQTSDHFLQKLWTTGSVKHNPESCRRGSSRTAVNIATVTYILSSQLDCHHQGSLISLLVSSHLNTQQALSSEIWSV